MLTINYRQIYETNEVGEKQWVLIIYDISANHYVGIPVYSKDKDGYLFLKSINKYADINSIRDYNRSKMCRCIYTYKKPLKLSSKEFNVLLESCKSSLINYMNDNIASDIDGLSYLKWCRDKYNFNKEDVLLDNLKQNGIYWVNMGVNVGSELRKLRPVILWRSTSDNKTWTMIPLTTKKRSDKYYFHYDLECLAEGSAKIENMMNYSYKRILAPYFSKGKLAMITKKDYNNIAKIISKYYLFK
jgi:mRNA-degrading endonuclease toxin of MazEF toxin-antitoxin module